MLIRMDDSKEAPYAVNAMREAMMGMYGNVYWEQVGDLLFLVPAAVLGSVLHKPLARFMYWYLRQVDQSAVLSFSSRIRLMTCCIASSTSGMPSPWFRR